MKTLPCSDLPPTSRELLESQKSSLRKYLVSLSQRRQRKGGEVALQIFPILFRRKDQTHRVPDILSFAASPLLPFSRGGFCQEPCASLDEAQK